MTQEDRSSVLFTQEGTPQISQLIPLSLQHVVAAVVGIITSAIIVAVVFGLFFKYIRRLFPPVVTGTVVLSIGLSLYTVAVGYMAGGAGAEDFGSARNWLVALVTLVACVAFANFGKGVLKLGSLLWGLLVGYGASLALGMVSFDGLAQEAWVALPAPVMLWPSSWARLPASAWSFAPTPPKR